MFFTDVNKFTLTCDLNFQKRKKDRERKEGREENEKGKKGERQIEGRKDHLKSFTPKSPLLRG